MFFKAIAGVLKPVYLHIDFLKKPRAELIRFALGSERMLNYQPSSVIPSIMISKYGAERNCSSDSAK